MLIYAVHESLSTSVLQDMTQRDLLEYFGDAPESIETADLPDVGQESSVSKHSAASQIKKVKVVSNPIASSDFLDDSDFQDHHSKVKPCGSGSESSSLMSKRSGNSDKSKKKMAFPKKTSPDDVDSSRRKTASKTSTLDTFILEKETSGSVCGGVHMHEEEEHPGSSAGSAQLASYLLSSVQGSPHRVSGRREDIIATDSSTDSL